MQLVIIGSGDQEKECKTLCKELNLKNVIFKGQLEINQVAKEIGKSHALVLCSTHETFGLVLIEAMSCGLPVISTDSGGPKDIVNVQNGFLVKNNIEQLTNAMENLKQNYNDFDSIQLRSNTRLNYSAESISKELKIIYQNLL